MKINDVLMAIFLILLIYIIYLQSCKKQNNIVSNTIKTEYIYDTIIKEFPIIYPKEKIIIYSDTQFIPYTDTNYCKELAKNYFAEKYYSDTLKNDSLIAYINTKVKNNIIIAQQLKYKILFPQQIINTIEENKFKVYLGPNVMINHSNIYIGGEIMLIDKKEFSYKLNANYSPVLNNYLIGIGFNYKLKFKK